MTNESLRRLTRLGFAARGLLYIMVGLFVLGSGRAEDPQGVLAYLGSGVGKWLVLAMAVGFAAYGLWKLGDALTGADTPGHDREAKARRLGAGVSGLVHLLLSWQALRLALAARTSAGDGAEGQASAVLDLPGGWVLLVAIAAGLGIAGVAQFIRAGRCTFLEDLDPRARETWVKWLGRIGYAARGIVFLLGGYFLLNAAWTEQGWRAAGLDEIIAELSSPLDLAVAAGLLLFGLYALVEARYRRIAMPDLDSVAAKVGP